MTATPSLIVAGAVSTVGPLPTLLAKLVAEIGGGCSVLHVEDAAADLLRSQPVDGVELVGLVEPDARLLPERLWAPAADEAIKAALEDKHRSVRGVVVYPHREYDPTRLFPRLRMSAKVADVPIIDGRTGNLIRRDPQDHMRRDSERVHPALRAAVDVSVPKKERHAS